jgi:hypothetical protein
MLSGLLGVISAFGVLMILKVLFTQGARVLEWKRKMDVSQYLRTR